MKPSDTRWLSYECCVKAVCKELPPLLQTLSQLYKSSGDAEAYGIYTPFWLVLMVHQVLTPIRSSVPLLSYLFMQKKIADFRKLPLMLKSTLDHL